jgi:hypothetical protein
MIEGCTEEMAALLWLDVTFSKLYSAHTGVCRRCDTILNWLFFMARLKVEREKVENMALSQLSCCHWLC